MVSIIETRSCCYEYTTDRTGQLQLRLRARFSPIQHFSASSPQHVQAHPIPIWRSSLVSYTSDSFRDALKSDKYFSRRTGRPHGVSLRLRRLASASACALWTASSIPSALHSPGMVRTPRLSSVGTRRCPVKRRCCPRTSTLSSTRRRSPTARAFTVCQLQNCIFQYLRGVLVAILTAMLFFRAAQVDSCQPACEPSWILSYRRNDLPYFYNRHTLYGSPIRELESDLYYTPDARRYSCIKWLGLK